MYTKRAAIFLNVAKNNTEISYSGFSQAHNIGNNANIGITGFATWKQKIQWQNGTLSQDWTWVSYSLWFQVPTLSFLS